MTIKLSDVLGLHNRIKTKNSKKKKKFKKCSFENLEGEYADDFDGDISYSRSLSVYNDDVIINYDWSKKIMNGLNGYNAVKDFKTKSISHPYAINAIKCHGPDIYFWVCYVFVIYILCD